MQLKTPIWQGKVMKSDKFSLRTRMNSFRHAVRGIVALLRDEHNSRIHFLATVIAIALGIIVKINFLEWSILAIVIGLVFVTELINSSLESLSDLIDPEWNEKIRQAKDYAAAAVLFSAIISVLVGALIFIPKIIGVIK